MANGGQPAIDESQNAEAAQSRAAPMFADIFKPLDWIRGGAYGLALSLVTLNFDSNTLTTRCISFTVGLFLFLSFDGFLRFQLRDEFFVRNDGRFPLLNLSALLVLFGLEVGGLFFFCAWVALFIANNCVTPVSGFQLIAIFCFLAAAHNIVYLMVVEFREKNILDKFWKKNWRRRLFGAIPNYFVTALVTDARECKLMPEHLWIPQLKGVERRFLNLLSYQDRHSASIVFINIARVGVRALLHAAMQFSILQAIFLNAMFGVFCIMGNSSGVKACSWWPDWLASPGGIVWQCFVVCCIFYCISSLVELHREGAFDQPDTTKETTKKAGLSEKFFQAGGNFALAIGILLWLCSLDGNRVIALTLGIQTIIMIFMLFGTIQYISSRGEHK